jgi:hypothetical protein
MVTKKNTPKANANRRSNRRPSKTDKSHTVPAEVLPQAERVTAAAMEATATLMHERSQIDTPMSAAEEITPAEPAPQPSMPSIQIEMSVKLSALDAAAKVLAEADQAMNCVELIAAIAAKGYWNSPRGRTPAATLYSALLRELQAKGDQARFCKTERGKFVLRRSV